MRPKKNFLLPLTAAVLLGLAGAARADVLVFSDTFNGENSGSTASNYTGFANWDVVGLNAATPGSVDLVNDGLYDPDPGGAASPGGTRGLYVDLDGATATSTAGPGTLVSKSGLGALSDLAAGTYRLDFYLAGNQVLTTGEDQVFACVFGPSDAQVSCLTYSMYGTAATQKDVTFHGPYQTGFTRFSQTFTLSAPTTIRLKFAGNGGDGRGMLLDDVALYQVAVVPLPSAVWLGLVPLGGLAFWRARERKRRRAL